MKKIAIATCAVKPEADPDEDLLLAKLREKGASVRLVAWDGPDPEVADDELCVLRSTWNYFEKLEAFLAWVDRVPRLLNPREVIHGNVRKTYLRDLGVPIVPTAWGHPAVGDTMRANGWDAVVIKPVVSAGSFMTKRFTLDEADAADAFLRSTNREMMIQAWMPAVDTTGERSIVWLDGEVSHAIRKSPRFAGGHESVTSVDIADDERAFAENVLAQLGKIGTPAAEKLLYARIDVIRDGDTLRLMELELVEPSLFLKQAPSALERFAAALMR